MKNLALILAVAFTTVLAGANQSIAQTIQPRFGIKAGPDLMSLTSVTSNGVTTNFDYKVGFQGGVFTEIPLAKQFSISPQVLFSQEGGSAKESFSLAGTAYNIEASIKTNYLEIPVLFAYKAQPNLSFYAGPQVAFLLSQKTTLKSSGGTSSQNTSSTSTDNFRKTSMGGNVGVGYHVNDNVGISLNYIFDFQSVADNSAAPSSGEKSVGFALSVNYLF